MLKFNIHKRGDSRRTDGSRIYWKDTIVFMWQRKPGKRDVTTHKFYLETWIDTETVLKGVNSR